jgi:hypothetical protein
MEGSVKVDLGFMQGTERKGRKGNDVRDGNTIEKIVVQQGKGECKYKSGLSISHLYSARR